MSGRPEQLSYLAKQVISDPAERKIVEDALLFLLRHQYIASPFHGQRRWRVTIGSGMGLAHSGPVAEAALYVGGEKKLFPTFPAID